MGKGSRETPATAPELEGGVRLEEHQTGWSDFLLDPGTYFDQLGDVEETVIKMFAEVPHFISSLEDMFTEFEDLDTVRLLETVSQAFLYLQHIGFCGTEFNIVVEDDASNHILRVVPVDQTVIELLLNTMSNEGWSADTTKAMLDYFGFDMTAHGQIEERERTRWAIVQILAIGLISYSGSHTSVIGGSWRRNLHQGPMTITLSLLSGQTKQIVLKKLPLACLDEFIGGPVWTFSLCETDHAPSHESGYSVLISLRSLADLWGPARAMYTDDTCKRIARIDVERGVIVVTHVSEHQPVRCHWYGWSQASPPATLEFSESSMLLIGCSSGMQTESSSTAANQSPRSDQVHGFPANTASLTSQDLLTLELNNDCPTSLGQVGKLLKMTGTHTSLGSSERTWYVEGVTLSGGLSKIITGGASVTLKRRSGVVRKALLRHNWDGPEPRVDTLDVRLVIEISACTGHSRRIPLLEVFKVPNVRSYIYTNNRSREEFKKTFFEAVDFGFKAFKTIWNVDQIFKESAINIIRQVLHELDETGPAQRRNEYPMAWFAGAEPDAFSIHDLDRHRWMKMLANSAKEVALLVLSHRCLIPIYGKSPCGRPCYATGLQTTLETLHYHHSPWMTHIARPERLPERTPVSTGQQKEISMSIEDEAHQRKLLQRLQKNLAPSTWLSNRRTFNRWTTHDKQDPASIEIPPVIRDESVSDDQSYEHPLRAGIGTEYGYKALNLAHVPERPRDRVQYIRVKGAWVPSFCMKYGEDIRGHRDQLDTSDTMKAWII